MCVSKSVCVCVCVYVHDHMYDLVFAYVFSM